MSRRVLTRIVALSIIVQNGNCIDGNLQNGGNPGKRGHAVMFCFPELTIVENDVIVVNTELDQCGTVFEFDELTQELL